MPATERGELCPHGPGIGDVSQHPGPGALASADYLCHLYECEQLSTYRIAELLGEDRQRVSRMLHNAGVALKPRGAGRRRVQDPRGNIAAALYSSAGLRTPAIGKLLEVPDRTVRGWLRARNVPMRPRGGSTREDRRSVAASAIEYLYVRSGLSAGETGEALGVAARVVLRSAHDAGLPVRSFGRSVRRGPTEIELIDAIYADPLVSSVLDRYGMRPVPPGGPIWQRFPSPLPVSLDLLTALYLDCGLALRHVELISGQPQQTLLSRLHQAGVPVRRAGGRSPFLYRWRQTARRSLGG